MSSIERPARHMTHHFSQPSTVSPATNIPAGQLGSPEPKFLIKKMGSIPLRDQLINSMISKLSDWRTGLWQSLKTESRQDEETEAGKIRVGEGEKKNASASNSWGTDGLCILVYISIVSSIAHLRLPPIWWVMGLRLNLGCAKWPQVTFIQYEVTRTKSQVRLCWNVMYSNCHSWPLRSKWLTSCLILIIEAIE